MKKQLFLTCLLTVMACTSLVSQNPLNLNVMSIEEYEVEERVEYRVLDENEINDFSELDWIEISPFYEKRNHRTVVNNDGSQVMDVQVLESSDNEAWANFEVKYHYDARGTSISDLNNQQLEYLPHSDFYIQALDSMALIRRQEGIRTHSFLPAASQLDPVVFRNDSIKTSANGYSIKNTQAEIKVNLTHNYVEMSRVNQPAGEPYYSYTSYQRSPQGHLIPRFELTHQFFYTTSGKCTEQIKSRSYTSLQYYVRPSSAVQEPVLPSQSRLVVYPNPADEDFTISLNWEESLGIETYSISLVNQFNEVVLLADDLSVNQEHSFNSSQLPRGIYTLKATLGEEVISQKLFKQ